MDRRGTETAGPNVPVESGEMITIDFSGGPQPGDGGPQRRNFPTGLQQRRCRADDVVVRGGPHILDGADRPEARRARQTARPRPAEEAKRLSRRSRGYSRLEVQIVLSAATRVTNPRARGATTQTSPRNRSTCRRWDSLRCWNRLRARFVSPPGGSTVRLELESASESPTTWPKAA
jgi:hypothetical protein